MKFFALSCLGLLFLSQDINADTISNEIDFSSKAFQKHTNDDCNDSIVKLKTINRTFDGTDNNCKHPNWGSVGQDFLRLCPANYQDGKSSISTQKIRPRFVSNTVNQKQNQPVPKNSLNINFLTAIYEQFIDYDISLALPSTEQAPITIPPCDLFFDPKCVGNVKLPYYRVQFDPKDKIRTNINSETAWLDGSQLYGSNEKVAKSLRTFQCGKLRTSAGNLLPKDSKGNFVSGDSRVNQNIALTTLYTAFVREHNRQCDIILKKNPKLKDQQVYTIARNYIIGLIQHITFDQYLPTLIGKENFEKLIGCYKYDEKTNPDIYSEYFATENKLHTTIDEPVKLIDDKGKVIRVLKPGQGLENPSLVTPKTVSLIGSTMIRQALRQRTFQLSDQLRNYLKLGGVRTDDASITIQLGRDMGVCSIPSIRHVLGLPPKNSISELFQDQQKAQILLDLYQQVKSIDLIEGVWGQKPVKNSALGEIGIKLTSLQWRNIRNGDKLWYEAAYPEQVVREIKNTSLADILKRNLHLCEVQENAFKTVC